MQDILNKLYYTKGVKLKEDELWLAALASENFTELNDILSNFLEDDMRIKLVKDVIMLSDNESIIDEYERDMLDRIQIYDTIKNATESGLAEGRAEGAETTTINIIKSMLEKKISYEDISDITNKSISDIKKIENSMTN